MTGGRHAFFVGRFPRPEENGEHPAVFLPGCLTGKNGLWRLREGGVPDDPHGRHAGNVPIPSPGYGQAEWHYRGTGNKAAGVPGCRVFRMVPMPSSVGYGLYRGSDIEDEMKRL